jgi:WD40 repeat protein
MRWVKLFLVFLLPILLTGCIAIPLPSEKNQFTETMEQQIEVGKTTRDEIIKSFGEPELSHSSTLFIYRLPRESMKLLIIAGGMGGSGIGLFPINRSDYVLFMEFDTIGTLKKYEALVYQSNAYDTIINPVPPKIADAKRTKIFNFDKNETDLFFWSRRLPIGFTNISFSADGKYLAALGKDQERVVSSIYIINLETNQSKVLDNNDFSHSVFSPDISKVLLARVASIKVVDTNTSNVIFKNDRGFWGLAFSALAFNADGSLIAVGNYEGKISIWDYVNNKELLLLKYEDKTWISSIAFSKDGRWLATVNADNGLKIWDAKSGALLDSRKAASGSIEFSQNNTLFAINAKDHVELWEIRESESPKVQLVDIFTLPGQLWDSWPKPSNYSLSFSQDGKYVAARNGTLVIYNEPFFQDQ